MASADHAVFYWIYRWPEWLSPWFWFWSEAIKTVWLRLALLVLAVFLITKPKLRVPTILALISWPMANGVTDLLKAGLRVPRPCVELSDVVTRVPKLDSFGTASAHSANMAAIATCFLLFFGWRAWPVLFIPLFVGLSRIYVGVHYPSQVVFGWFVGCSVALCVVLTYRFFNKRGTEAPERP